MVEREGDPKAMMTYTEQQYLDAMESYFSPDDEMSHQQLSLVRTRVPHECMGIDHEGGDIPAGSMAVRETGIHQDFGRGTCYVCLPCADVWVGILHDG